MQTLPRSRKTIRKQVSTVILTVSAMLLLSSAAAAQEIELRGPLAGGAIDGLRPSGHADYRERPNEKRFSTEVEDVKLPAGTVLTVFIIRPSGTEVRVGSLTLDQQRGGDLNLDSRDGDFVPIMRAGVVVIVREADGTAVLSGVMRRKR